MAATPRDRLMPGFWSVFREVILAARQEGIGVKITSTYRSPAQQAALYQDYLRRIDAFERGEIDDVGLPAAPPGHSYHEVGLAIDVITRPPDGIERVAEIAEDFGLRWGGDFGDPVHFDAGNSVALPAARKSFNPRRLVAI